MGGQSIPGFADRVIATIAARQFGVVARWQLAQAGVSARRLDCRIAGGRLHRIHPGVYLVGHGVPAQFAREMAALLACGEGAAISVKAGRLRFTCPRPMVVLSHRSAAAIWNLNPYPASGDVCLTVAPGRNNDRSGIEIHRANLTPRDIRRRHGMALTSPPRTILDLAAPLGTRGANAKADPLERQHLDELERIVAEAHYRKLATDAELRDQITRNPYKHGIRALRAVLDLPGGPRRTRSPAERALLRLLRERGVNGYETNAKVAGHEVDFLWRAERLAVEVDGWDAHSGRVAFERDRLKIAVLKAQGIATMPVTGRQIQRDPDGIVARLLAALGR